MSTSSLQVPILRPEQITRIEDIINYKFQKHGEAYLWEALQVISPVLGYCAGRFVKAGNKKLAIMGDAAMSLVLAEYWFGDRLSIPGDWGDLSGSRLSNEHLDKVAAGKNLVDCLDRPFDACGKKSPATLLEAIVGAVYLDSDHDLSAARRTMIVLGFTEVLQNDLTERQPELLGRVSQAPTSQISSITVEYGVPNSRRSDQTVVYRTIPVSST